MRNTLIVLILIVFISCKSDKNNNGKLNIVTTTTMITDLVKNIGGEVVNVQGLMGAGVDPHLYKASAGDVAKLANADVVFYNGLHLEGKLIEVFEQMNGQLPIALAESLDKSQLLKSDNFASNYDPHVWFNIDYFKQFAKKVAAVLSEANPEHKTVFSANLNTYLSELDALKKDIQDTVNTLPVNKRILVTAHDAFNYFGESYQFNVLGLQGLSTATEAGVKDVQQLAKFIIDHKIKAIFVETSVPQRTIEALKEAVLSKNHNVNIGGTLYSDALGDTNTPQGTYLGMYRYNVKTIVSALQ